MEDRRRGFLLLLRLQFRGGIFESERESVEEVVGGKFF